MDENSEQRLAIAENEIVHNKKDLDEFFAFVRETNKKEERERLALTKIIQRLKTRVDQQTYFISGVATTVLIVWSAFKFLLKG